MNEFLIVIGVSAIAGLLWFTGAIMGAESIEKQIKKGNIAIDHVLYVCQMQNTKLQSYSLETRQKRDNDQ